MNRKYFFLVNENCTQFLMPMYYYMWSKQAKIVETKIIPLFSSWVLGWINSTYFCSCKGEGEAFGGCGFMGVDKQFPSVGKTPRIETDPFSTPGAARETWVVGTSPFFVFWIQQTLCSNCQPLNSVGNLTMCLEVVVNKIDSVLIYN